MGVDSFVGPPLPGVKSGGNIRGPASSIFLVFGTIGAPDCGRCMGVRPSGGKLMLLSVEKVSALIEGSAGGGAPAQLAGANLRGADLRDADLGDALLEATNLSDSNLVGAVLEGVDFEEADLKGSQFCNSWF